MNILNCANRFVHNYVSPAAGAAKAGLTAAAMAIREVALCRFRNPNISSSAFLNAIAEGDSSTVQNMLDNGFDPFDIGMAYGTALNYATELGNEAIVRQLIQAAPLLLRGTDISGRTPLHIAVSRHNDEVARILIQAMDLPQFRAKTSFGKTARDMALDGERHEIVAAIDEKIRTSPCDQRTFNQCIARSPFSKIKKEHRFKALQKKYGLKPIFDAIIKIENDFRSKKIKYPDVLLNGCALVGEVLEKRDTLLDTGAKKVDECLKFYNAGYRTLSEEKQKKICEYLRRVNKCELVCKLNRINQLPPLSAAQRQALKEQNWKHSIFKDRRLEELAFGEFLSGNLDPYEVSEIFIYHECMQADVNSDFSRAIPLFKDGKRNEEAVRLLKISTAGYYADKDIEKFLEDPELQNAQIYSVPITPRQEKGSVLNEIVERLGHTFLTYKSGRDPRCQIVMSPRLMEKFFHAKVGAQAPRLNAVLGPSVSFDNFTDPTKRDVLVPCRLFPGSQPKVADGHPASPLEFWYHDVAYHAYLASLNPHRAAYIELADLLKDKVNLRRSLLDQEFSAYRIMSPEESFWATMEHTIFSTRILGIGYANPTENKVVEYMKANGKRWAETYQITPPQNDIYWISKFDPFGLHLP